MNFQDFLPYISLGIAVITIGGLFKIYNDFMATDAYEQKHFEASLKMIDLFENKCTQAISSASKNFKNAEEDNSEAGLWQLAIYELYSVSRDPKFDFQWKGRAWMGDVIKRRKQVILNSAILWITDMIIMRSPSNLADVIKQFTSPHVQDLLGEMPGIIQMLSEQFEIVAQEHKTKQEASADDLREGN